MGQIVAAAILSHHPGIVMPEAIRVRAGAGRDTTLVAGFARFREILDAAKADTFVIFDTHWITTMAHLVTAHEHHKGEYSSDEMPAQLSDVPYDYPGAPELARAVEEVAKERGVPAHATADPRIPQHYPTLNLLRYLHRGERVMSVGTCQNARGPHFLSFGEVVGEAIRRTDGRVALMASGALSHDLYTLDDRNAVEGAWDAGNIRPQYRPLDERVVEHMKRGEHAAVIDLYPELRSAHYEGWGSHIMQMYGALGGSEFQGAGTPLSELESAIGSGNIHISFDVSAAG